MALYQLLAEEQVTCNSAALRNPTNHGSQELLITKTTEESQDLPAENQNKSISK